MSTPANPMTGQLPTMNPQQLVSLFPQQGGGAPGAAPPTGGAPAPAQTPDIMQEMVQASQQGRQTFGAESGKVGSLGGQAEKLIGEQAAQPIPKTGWLDTQGQPQQGGFLHNLGRALMAIGGATSIGQDIQAAQYGPGIRRYGAEQGARAKQIEELTGQQAEHEKLATAGAGMVSKPITAAGSLERGQAAMSRAETYATLAKTQAQGILAGIDLKKATLNEKSVNDTAKVIQAKVDEAGRNFREQHRDATAEDVAHVLAGTKEELANEAAARNPSAWQQIQQSLGWGSTPQIPGTATPQQTPTPNAPTGSASKKPSTTAAPKGAIGYTSGGKQYHIPSGMEKEFLKDHPDAKRN